MQPAIAGQSEFAFSLIIRRHPVLFNASSTRLARNAHAIAICGLREFSRSFAVRSSRSRMPWFVRRGAEAAEGISALWEPVTSLRCLDLSYHRDGIQSEGGRRERKRSVNPSPGRGLHLSSHWKRFHFARLFRKFRLITLQRARARWRVSRYCKLTWFPVTSRWVHANQAGKNGKNTRN